ncbi:putative DCC family thiol-disulfide oxidoreductase YuxK [Neobacillus niacini]|uniref:thiol-disulfide oxidoreductase DCC family protein n=1 Tax=Neobacillus driksii TaxID=3035913 RepID=UPI00277EE920|nr:thiol-disulfide oxidoreductase DCC family protein [Neobacillus niacini]MDQ0970914.1 putative DCC family thiol-disulfide oxidoreductase YuxK [Neobacillus niacini]
MGAIILFDGVCNFCNSSVQFIIKRDPTGYFKFASLQSETGQQQLEKYGVSKEIDSLIVIEKQSVYIKSSAALQISRKLTGFWRFFSILRVFPPVFRDYLYDLVAKNRYNWFGKRDSCMLPTAEMKKRFLD